MEQKVFDAIRSLFPITTKDGYIIKLQSIYLKNKERYSPTDYPGQKQAIEQNKTYGPPIYIDYVIMDKTGKKIKEGTKKIGNLPIETMRRTYIVDGVEYQMTKQFLLKPGIYTQENNVGQVESFVNVPGLGMKITFDPKKLMFIVKVRQAKIPLYSFLRILGMSDTQIKNAWGKEIFEANKRTDIGVDARRLFRVFYSYEEIPQDINEVMQKVRDYLEGRELNPETTKLTLGKSYSNLNAEALLEASKKIIRVLKSQDEPDRKDDVAFKRIRVASDLVADRILKSAKSIINKIKTEQDLTRFGQVIKQTFTMSNLSEIPMEINPVTIFNAGAKTTIMGEDGISSVHSIPDEARNLSPAQIGFVDPVNTPESIKSGVTVNLTIDADHNKGEIERYFINPKTGQKEKKRAIDVYDKYVAFPDQYNNGKWKDKNKVVAVYKGKQVVVPASKIDYVIPDTLSTFTLTTNMVPFAQHNHGNRLAMASRQIPQAVSLVHREAPLVQVEAPDLLKKAIGETTMEDAIARISNALKAPEDGTISKVTEDEIILKGKSGKKYTFKLYKDFPMANKSYLTNEPLVKAGDKVKKGQLLADNNFTKNGTLALGANLKVAYMPWKSYTFEDGIVVSESAAKKLTSSHIIQYVLDDKAYVIDKAKFVSLYPMKYTQEQLAKIGDNGLAKKGAKLEPGDPIMLALKEETGTPEDMVLQKLHKSLVKPYKDKSITWEYSTPGIVTTSVKAGGEAKVFVKTDMPAVVGDKLALRHGMKGVITAIVPDEEMPVSRTDGKPAEVLISPESVITRMSMGQMLEAAASKVAKKTGKPYVVKNFSGEKYLDKVQKDLKKAGFDPDGTEEFVDPKTGKSYGKVFSGYPQVQKLFKITKGNFSARQVGSYDMDLRPVKGGEEGAKAIDFPQLFYSLVSHNARANLRDAATYKGEFNPEAWQALLSGAPLPAPKTPFVYKKFESMLTAAGIVPKRNGDQLSLVPLTDKDVDELAGKNEIQNFSMLDHKLQPVKGGLFDKAKTGGTNGQQWAKINLPEPVPNPAYASALKLLLDLKDSEYQQILKGLKQIDGKTGGEAFKAMLKKINVDKEIERLKEEYETAAKTKKDKIKKKLAILRGLKKQGLKPEEVFIISKVPVIPPIYRPIFELPNGTLTVSSANYLYRDLGYVAQTLKEAKNLPDAEKAQLREEMYQALGALQGVTGFNPISKQALNKNAKGFIKTIAGDSPKTGFFQNKVMRKQQDLSGRATAAVENNLSMDEVLLPKKMAQKLYGPFAQRKLIQMGYKPDEAKKQIEELTEVGKRALEDAMAERPVLLNRAPSLHKFSIMAFKPKMYDGLTLKVPGLITSPYNLDFDGDTMQVHVPFSEEARQEAFKMLPSRNLWQIRVRDLNYMPAQEAVTGLYLLTKDGKKTNKKYKSLAEIKADLKAGKINITDVIKLNNKTTTPGRELINAILPDEYDLTGPVDKGRMKEILKLVAEKYPDKYKDIVEKLKEIGDEYATQTGFSISLNDLRVPGAEKIRQEYKKAMGDMNKLRKIDQKAQELASKVGDNNNFGIMVRSGGRGKPMNIKQIAIAPGLVMDMKGDILPTPVTSSYGEGMEFTDFVSSLYGVRKGMMDIATMTAKPGAFAKEVLSTTADLVVTMHDCGTMEGIEMDKNDPNIIGRVLAKDYGEFKRNSVITSFVASKLPQKVLVRSPLTCEAPHGVCQLCFGHDESGHFPPLGTNVGVKSAQAMTEPLTQAALSTKHTGGVASAGNTIGGFYAIQQYMQIPKNFNNEAVLAEEDGTVKEIKARPGGGWDVKINNKQYFVPPKTTLLIKKGQRVKKGDKLNAGIPHPEKVMQTQGFSGLVNEMKNIYEATGIKIDPRNIETVFRGITGYVEVIDPGNTDYVPGDIVPLSTAKKEGIKQYRRVPIGTNKAHSVSDNWMARLGFRNLSRGLTEGALYGYNTNIHGYHPVPAYATGEIRLNTIEY